MARKSIGFTQTNDQRSRMVINKSEGEIFFRKINSHAPKKGREVRGKKLLQIEK